MASVETASLPPQKLKPAAQRPHRRRHRQIKVKTGNLPLLVQLAIIVAAALIAGYVLLSLLKVMDQSKSVPLDNTQTGSWDGS